MLESLGHLIIDNNLLCVVAHVILALERLRQEDWVYQASFVLHRVTLSWKQNKPQQKNYFFNLILFLLSYYCWLLLYWGYIVTFTKVLTTYHSWIHPFIILFYSPSPPIPGMVLTVLIFPVSYMSTQHFHHIHPPTPFPYILPPPTGTKPQAGPVLPFCPWYLKKDIFVF
jgi:hypothetical protein